MPSDDDSFQPSLNNDGSSDIRESDTLFELKRKMSAKITVDSNHDLDDSSESSHSDEESSSAKSAEQTPLPRKIKSANNTPKKKAKKKKTSEVDNKEASNNSSESSPNDKDISSPENVRRDLHKPHKKGPQRRLQRSRPRRRHHL
jgi:hypothetical protein